MLDALGAAVCVADADALLYVNAAFEALTGWSADEAIGRGRTPCSDRRRPSSRRAVGRSSRSRAATARRCAASWRPASWPTASWAVVPRRRATCGSDEAVMVETVLRVERDRAQSYLDVASALLVILYADGTVGLLNRHGRELLDDPRGELIGANWIDEVIPPEERDDARARVRAAGARRRGAVERYEARRASRAAGGAAGSPGRRPRWSTPRAAWWPCCRARTSPTACGPSRSCGGSRSSTR